MSTLTVLIMYSIGDLAQLGGVTPRMLRHYHDLGVLVPAEVDHATSYRRYHETQLADLLQVLALKGLGFALTDIKRVIDGGVSPAELRGMLLLRRTEVASELDEATARLQRVERHIQRLENHMSNTPNTANVTTKRLPAAHLAVLSAVSPSFASSDIGPTIQPLYPRLIGALQAAGVEIAGAPIAYYVDAPDGGLAVHAGFTVDPSVTSVPGLEIVDLPEVPLAATAIHHGDMATVDVDTYGPILDWVGEHGFATTGFSRELYLDCPEDLSQWRTEIQFPIATQP